MQFPGVGVSGVGMIRGIGHLFLAQTPNASFGEVFVWDPETVSNYWTFSGLAFLAAVVCLSLGLHARRKKHLIDDLPTSKVAGVFIGLVELKGTAESEAPFVSHLRGARCVQYQWRVEEHWRKTETVRYRDKDGNSRTRTKTTSGWRTVDRGGRIGPFYLRDDTGVIRILGWLGMTYNSLVCVRERMRRAWSTVDVELKRRATLIPKLVNVLQGLKAHERSVQEAVMHLRTQQGATEPGRAGPDPRGCVSQLRAAVEAYPVLNTDAAFRKLQTELVHTEERIALARSYFNEVCTHYNTRLEVWPDRLVARLGAFPPHPLIVAHDFERAEVRVNLVD
ncbi:MAG: LemA family protein [Verrucomicrobia bacterium]|nr:LemA family protein [Verrucomicrobiota bacterium]MCH8529154.1 LemA family protein [Kiritimatiellia bacterium]